jgi:hypothetical protein
MAIDTLSWSVLKYQQAWSFRFALSRPFQIIQHVVVMLMFRDAGVREAEFLCCRDWIDHLYVHRPVFSTVNCQHR